MKGLPLGERLGFATVGLRAAIRRESTLRTHLCFALAALIVAVAMVADTLEFLR